MWALNNNTPFAAERTWVRDKEGAEVWVVAVKGTFEFNQDGNIKLADSQEEVHQSMEFFGDAENTGLKHDIDFSYDKPNTDVIVIGHAYAPNQLATTSCEVTLRVANINKTLNVTGDRYWQETAGGFSISDPEPFLKLPLVYERAFGGVDVKSENDKDKGYEAQNPVGQGFVMLEEHLKECPLPNIEYPHMRIQNWNDRPIPAGFAPIARHWEPRVGHAGTYDQKWEEERYPLYPEDYQNQFQQQAPEDQQAGGYLNGGEYVELINLTPEGYVRFQLPQFLFEFKTKFTDGEENHQPNLQSLFITPDKNQFSMVWLSALPCHPKVHKLLYSDLNIKELILRSAEYRVA